MDDKLVMDDKIVAFTGTTTVDLPVQKLVDNIKWDQLDSVLVIGTDKNGEVHLFANKAEIDPMIALIERVKFDLLAGVYNK
jgi:hypothetical protein